MSAVGEDSPALITEGAIALRFGRRHRISDGAFRAFCRANPELRLERTAEGDLIVMAPAGADSGSRNAGITAQLWLWNRQTNLGVVLDSSAGFTLPNTAIRSPDAAWIRHDRWQALSEAERRGFAHIVPDFVVELRSASDALKVVREKMSEYIDQGACLGWLIDPRTGTVEIHRPGRPIERLTGPQTLSGEDVLPGFTLDLNGIL